MKTRNTAIVKIVCTLSALIVSLLLLTSCSLKLTSGADTIPPEMGGDYVILQYDYDSYKVFDPEETLYFKFTLLEEFKFDYVEISYTATENIKLEGADVERIEYSGNKTSFYKEFSAITAVKGISLKYSETVIDHILVLATVYKDGEIVNNSMALSIPVIASEYGVFFCQGDAYDMYCAYVNRLFKLGLINRFEKHDAECSYSKTYTKDSKEKTEKDESDIEEQVVN